MDAVCTIRYLRTHRAVVTETPHKMASITYVVETVSLSHESAVTKYSRQTSSFRCSCLQLCIGLCLHVVSTPPRSVSLELELQAVSIISSRLMWSLKIPAVSLQKPAHLFQSGNLRAPSRNSPSLLSGIQNTRSLSNP